MKFASAVVLIVLAATPALGQTIASAPQDAKAQAQFEFMMGRRMESAGDPAGALASLERARKLDPEAAEIPAEIAGYYYRQNRPTDAVTAAQQALKIDKNNVEAHNILGTVFSAWADGGAPPPAGQ
ncbi:MAG TPA: tetratricopeptide repeat protein, partial [Vicinamibacterales bacterium]|nr:tetratricopeptide repeat protein [Vicinamibacterales bacterium]